MHSVYKNKRGISEIIVTVLMVLLVIAAVIIVWTIISAFLKSNSETISLGVSTIALEIDQKNTRYGQNGLEVRVTRASGSGNLSGVSVLIEDDTGQQMAYDYTQEIGELEAKIITVPASEIEAKLPGAITKVSVAPFSITSSGSKKRANPTDSYIPGKGFVSNDGLVLYMPFDEDAKDKSGNGNDGIVTNAVLTAGKIGQAYSFDGNGDYITISSIKSLSAQQVSVVAWVYPTAYNTATGFNHIINKIGTTNYVLYGPMSAGQTYLAIGATSYPTPNPHVLGINTAWYHLAGIYNSSTISLYKDNVKLTNTLTAVTLATTGDLIISGSGVNSFNGKIDEVRIYNRSLSDKEVQYLYKYG